MAVTGLMLVVMVLAAYRATTLVVQDTILDTPRLAYLTWCANGGAFRRKISELASCAYCSGFWASQIVYHVVVLGTDRWSGTAVVVHQATAWAVAGGQALLNRLDAVVGIADEAVD